MGTPDFAVPTLKALYDNGYDVAAVFTQPDKPKGRGYKLMPPPVKVLAEENRTPVYQPASLKKEPAKAVEIIKKYSPDVIVVAAYGKILPKEVLQSAKYGCINVHGSLLPKYRGAAPIQQSVLNGDEFSGVTTMQMAEGLDTGDILLQAKTPIGINETSAELFDRLAKIGAELLIETLENIESIAPKKQDESKSSYAGMLSKDMCLIDFSKDAFWVNKHICGLSDWPCAVMMIGGKRVKVYKSELVEKDRICGKAGEVIDEKSLTVACGKGSVKLTVVQAEGGRRMSSADYLRGKPLKKGEIIG